MFNKFSRNELVPMTRRYPDLKKKVLRRDSVIAAKIIRAWDLDQDSEKALSIFLREKQKLSDYRYWELLRSLWIVCGCIENQELFRLLFSASRKYRYYFSTAEEHTYFRALSDFVTVFRATDDKNDFGISWTLSKDYAFWYLNQYSKKMVLEKEISKDKIFAYIDRNGESEVIIL